MSKHRSKPSPFIPLVWFSRFSRWISLSLDSPLAVARIGVTRSTQACFLAADRQCTELPPFSDLLGEKGEGAVISRALRALRAGRESSEASFARRSRMARFTPFTEAMEMRSAWCDTNERREWGGYAVRSTPER